MKTVTENRAPNIGIFYIIRPRKGEQETDQMHKHTKQTVTAALYLPAFLIAEGFIDDDLIDPVSFPRPFMEAVRISDEIVIDGFLDEPAWMLADSITDFYQTKPYPGAPATEQTVVRTIYDDRYLYVSAICYDNNPQGIIATSLEQDFDSQNTDVFGLSLDTFYDRESAFVFLFNVNGAVKDLYITNDGAGYNANWEGVVYPKTRLFERGWVIEMAIPFTTLRFEKEREYQNWGINFLRRIRRKTEDVYWSPLQRHERLLKISKAGTLTGLKSIQPSRNLGIKPFAIGDGRWGQKSESSGDIGLDVKLGITPSLTLDLTYNTDFSQVEADDERINLTRFPIFFPEKRDFFLENANIFTFGDISKLDYRMAPNRYSREFFLFNSRRIGLERGSLIPIVGGGRLSGNIGNYEIGALGMQTQGTDLSDPTNFGVFRMRRKILERSNVGFMMINKSSPASAFNQSYGVDANFQFFRYLVLYGYHARTEGPSPSNQSSASRIAVAWRDHFWNTSFYYKQVGESFNPEVGFIRRTGVSEVYGTLGVHKQLRDHLVYEINPYIQVNQVQKSNAELETQTVSAGLDFIFADGARMMNKVTSNREGVFYAFPLYGTMIDTGDYSFNSYSSYFISNKSRPLSVTVGVSGGGFYRGTRRSVNLNSEFRIGYRFSIQLRTQRNEISLPGSDFTVNTYSAKIKYNHSTTLFNTLFIQYNEADEKLIVNARINLIHAPLSDLFLVYSEVRDFAGESDRTGYVALKLTKLFAI